MVRAAVDATKRIESDRYRNHTFYKRKKGLFKKSIEMSKMCDKKVFVSIFDEKTKSLVIYQSHDDYVWEMNKKLLKEVKVTEKVTNECYDEMNYNKKSAKALNIKVESQSDKD